MIWILIVAGIILFVVFLNSILGTVQKSKTEVALEALKKMSAPFAFVLRGGATKKIPTLEIVPGDMVILNAGNSVPADLRLLKSASLKIDEAPLTGESVPEEKFVYLIK